MPKKDEGIDFSHFVMDKTSPKKPTEINRVSNVPKLPIRTIGYILIIVVAALGMFFELHSIFARPKPDQQATLKDFQDFYPQYHKK